MDAVDLLSSVAVGTVVAEDEAGNTPATVAAKEGHDSVVARLGEAADTEYVCVELGLEWQTRRSASIVV